MKNVVISPFPADIAAHSTALIATDATPIDGTSGRWVMLLPKGTFSGRDGRGPWMVGSDNDLQQIVASTLQRAGATELVIDYDHQTMFGAVPGVGGRAPAAGWIKKFEIRPEGLFGLVEWTETAAQSIRAGEYRYISPVYRFLPNGKILQLISAGLTNVPNLDLAAVAASALPNHQETETNMKSIAKALGLPEDASEAEILTATNAVLTSNTALVAAAGVTKSDEAITAIAAMRSNVGTVDPTKYVPIAQVVAMQESIKTLQTSVSADKAETAVNSAIAEGKLPPALKDWGLDLHKTNTSAFDAFISKSPVLTAAQRAVTPPTGKTDAALDDADIAIMSQMGLTREEMLKAKTNLEASH